MLRYEELYWDIGGLCGDILGYRRGLRVEVSLVAYASKYLCMSVYRYIWGCPKIGGSILGGPHKKDFSIWGLDWGPPILGNYQIRTEPLYM